jgi:hypothetical protein
MPGLSGTELAQTRSQLSRPTTCHPVIRTESGTYGYPFIRKPIRRSDLQRLVAETSGRC